jgi:hypothetical protein
MNSGKTPFFFKYENITRDIQSKYGTISPWGWWFHLIGNPRIKGYRVCSKLPNSEQSYKGKVKTHNEYRYYIHPPSFFYIFIRTSVSIFNLHSKKYISRLGNPLYVGCQLSGTVLNLQVLVDSSPCITTCKIKTDKNNTCKTCVMLITSSEFTSNLTGKTYYTKSFDPLDFSTKNVIRVVANEYLVNPGDVLAGMLSLISLFINA